MRGVFEDEALDPVEPRNESRPDTEFTLGSGTLLGVFFGLVLLCGVCFGLGYALGSRGSRGPVFKSQPPAAGPASPVSPEGTMTKPSAIAQAPTAPPPQPDTDAAPPVDPNTTTPPPVPGGQSSAPATPSAPVAPPSTAGWHPVQPPVQAAMPPTANGAQPAQQTGGPSTVQPAMPSANALMVQIAAVSNPEDASVLLGALRKRGYAVSAVRNPADNLIHVCVGPFSNRNDANAMRQKLLNDGYNAIVLP